MTCRNYIPGPNGDCQRCGEMGINHAGTGYTLDEIMAAAQSGEIDRARAMFNASVKFRCGEMRAGHAGKVERLGADPEKLKAELALLPGLKEALLWKPNTPQLENAMTYAWEQAIKSFIRAIEENSTK